MVNLQFCLLWVKTDIIAIANLAVRLPRAQAIHMGKRVAGMGYHSRIPRRLKKKWHKATWNKRYEVRIKDAKVALNSMRLFIRQLYEDAGVCCMFAGMFFVFAVNITCKCVYTVSTNNNGRTAVLATVMFVAAVKKGISYSQCLILFQPIIWG